jgi:hypothetical protein
MNQLKQYFYRRVVSILLLLASLYYCGVGVSLAHSVAQTSSYVAVIDAGSSGSRIYLYETRRNASFLEIRTPSLRNASIKPGLSSYSQTSGPFSTERAGSSLKPLLDSPTEYLAANNIQSSQVPVYVLATAGMRRLDRDQPEISVAIYDNVQNTIRIAGYLPGRKAIAQVPGDFLGSGVGTLSGQYEALFGWEDINFLAGNFSKNQTTNGIVEFGGASVQVAYAVPEDFSNNNIVTRKINNKSYRIFALSYLDVGLDQIANRAIEQQPDDNPCFVRGTPQIKAAGREVSGDFNFSACSSLVSAMLNPVWMKNPPNPKGSNFENIDFLGIGAIPAKLARWNESAGVIKASSDLAIERYMSSIKAACVPNNWQTFMTWFNGPEEYAPALCAHSTYIYNFLMNNKLSGQVPRVNSLGLAPGHFRISGMINDNATTWTRGLIIDLTSE